MGSGDRLDDYENDNFFVEEDEEFKEQIVKALVPAILTTLLEENILKPEDLDNKKYVWKMIKEHCDAIIEETPHHVLIHHNFLESCKSEYKNDRPEAGIVMAGVCIESMINLFYRDALYFKHGLDHKEIDKVLQSISIPDKLTWFLKVSFGIELPNEIIEKVTQINSVRNKIVHFKAIPCSNFDSNDGSFNIVRESVKSFTLNDVESVITKLEDELKRVECSILPNYGLALSACTKLFE